MQVHAFHRLRDRISGRLVLAPPRHEIRLTHYAIYWGNRSGEKLARPPFAVIPVGGEPRIELQREPMPPGAGSIVVITANENGEMKKLSAAGDPNVFLVPDDAVN